MYSKYSLDEDDFRGKERDACHPSGNETGLRKKIRLGEQFGGKTFVVISHGLTDN